MAGIAGLISKKAELEEKDLNSSFASMMQKLSFSDSQLSNTFTNDNIWFGNVLPISTKVNNHYQNNDLLRLYAVIDGLVFVDAHERRIIMKKYDLDYKQPDCFYIPFLYKTYKEDFVKHFTGWFNIFIYDDSEKVSLLINDRLGFLPLYYYDSDSFFIFGTKIEAILASGLISSIKADAITIAEHLFFNYPLSDYTYIKDIHTLSNAELLKIEQNKITRTKFWSINKLFDFEPVDKKESFQLMDNGLQVAISKITSRFDDKINLSLTGGWDSRVVLSYFLPNYNDLLSIYSFGAEGSDDILIPQQIAQTEKLDYTPYILDQNYLDNSFISNALRTIELSSGTRNYLRTHYLYAVQHIAGISDTLVTGIFGDEVFKVAQATGGEVLSKNAIDLLKSNFDIYKILQLLSNDVLLDYIDVNSNRMIEGFAERLKTLKSRMQEFESINKKYYALRFEYNLRKYFGNEANSYNDFVFCFSPFTDYDFLTRFASTKYFGIHHAFNSNSIYLKKQSTKLYHDIVNKNYNHLVVYNTSRGYSMKDSNSLIGNFKIICKNYLQKTKNIDAFNTRPTTNLFVMFLKEQDLYPTVFKHPYDIILNQGDSNIHSLFYWLGIIDKRYQR